MIYHPRLLEDQLRLYHQTFPCVLVTGARQVGKSTLVGHLFGDQARTLSLIRSRTCSASVRIPISFCATILRL
ncbi:MAG: hypothetical protein AB1634_17225 [Thermodesulfobacteriota bacterium]